MQATTGYYNSRMTRKTRPKIAAELEWRNLTDGADEDVTHAADDEHQISRLDQLSNGTAQLTRYVSWEAGRFPLDGSMLAQPDTSPVTGQIGAVSEDVSDSAGEFEDNLVLRDTWPVAISSSGLTIHFDTALGEYATAFQIRTYNSDVPVDTINAVATSSLYVYEGNLNDYDKLEIEISKWSAPGQCARIAQVLYGIVWVKDNLTLVDTLSVLRQINPVNADSRSSEARFAFDDREGTFNFMNSAGDSAYITSRQKVFVRIGFQGELMNAGAYQMSEWRSENGRFIGRALDALSLSDVEFPDDTYTDETLYNIAEDALDAAGITSYSLDASLSSIIVSCEVTGLTCRQVLSYIATAACLTLYVDIDGITTIGALPSSSSGYAISYDNAQKPVGSMDQPLKKITVGYGTEGLEVTESYESSGREISITGNPFITTEARAIAVREWLEDYYLRRKVYRSDWRGDPKLEAGDVVGVQNDFATPDAQIESTQLDYTEGGLSGQIYSREV